MLTSQTLDIQKRKYGLLQNKTALNQSLLLRWKEILVSTVLRKNAIWIGRRREKVLVGKGGSILMRHVGVGLDIAQWDSLWYMEYEKTF